MGVLEEHSLNAWKAFVKRFVGALSNESQPFATHDLVSDLGRLGITISRASAGQLLRSLQDEGFESLARDNSGRKTFRAITMDAGPFSSSKYAFAPFCLWARLITSEEHLPTPANC